MTTQRYLFAQDTDDAFWTSLKYFNFYRLAVASLFLLATLVFGELLNLGGQRTKEFVVICAAYFAAAVMFQAVIRKWPQQFELQLTVHVLADIAALVLMMNASGGFRSGIGVMLLISLAGAALVSRGALMLFYAAVASIALLIEQAYWVLVFDASTANFVQPGLLSIGYFATALITNQLAQRVIVNERVARRRGAELANQLQINQLAIRDIQDGILVVDANDLVRQHNPAVERMLGGRSPELDQIDAYSFSLAQALRAWIAGSGPDSLLLELSHDSRQVRARFVAAGVAGERFSLIFLEDMSGVQERARQLKLAALGRLTASIAHEIRNPLSAITHASDLLAERDLDTSAARLLRIVKDNAVRMEKLVRDILELSRRDRARTEAVKLAEYLRNFADEFLPKERIPASSVRVSVPDDIVIRFDPVHLNQILWNLVRNAWRYCRKSTHSIHVQAMRMGDRIELHVKDDGPGVPKELQAQLFEPFFSTHSHGTGLGIYIARELCDANGARLDYISTAPGGDFRITWWSN